MFRENVLIALTILITILALSYIILMTVFMQMHDMERRIKLQDKMMQQQETEQQQQKGMVIDNDVYLRTMQQQQEIINKERERDKADKDDSSDDDEDDADYNDNQRVSSSNDSRGRWIPEKENENWEAFNYPDFGFHDQQSPPDAIIFPFQFYDNNGHLTLRVPDDDRVSNLTVNEDDELIMLLEVMSMINAFMSKQSAMQKRVVFPYEKSRFLAPPLKGHVWFKQRALKNITENASKVKSNKSINAIIDEEPDEEDDQEDYSIFPPDKIRIKRSFVANNEAWNKDVSHKRLTLLNTKKRREKRFAYPFQKPFSRRNGILRSVLIQYD